MLSQVARSRGNCSFCWCVATIVLFGCQLETKGTSHEESAVGGAPDSTTDSGGVAIQLPVTTGGSSGDQVVAQGSVAGATAATLAGGHDGSSAAAGAGGSSIIDPHAVGGTSEPGSSTLAGGHSGDPNRDIAGASSAGSDVGIDGVGGSSSSGGTDAGGADAGGADAGGADAGGANAGGADAGGAAGSNGAAAGSTAAGSSGCASGASPCTAIVEYTASQVVDGESDDFCGVASFEMSFASAARVIEYNAAYGRDYYPERAEVRLAWSPYYVHAFVRVLDPCVVPADTLDYIWGADSIEIMITADNLVTGSPANDRSALRVIAAPWSHSTTGMAAHGLAAGTNVTYTALPAEQFVVKADGAGYTVELKVPWQNGMLVQAGSKIRFDFAINAAVAGITSGWNVRDAQAIYHQGFVMGSPCGDFVAPYCDDRTWCETTLEAR